MSSTHRKDITRDDLLLLGLFCSALQKLLSHQAEPGACFYELGSSYLCVPVWYKSVSKWKIKQYKTFLIEAIGIELVDFRNIARYIGIKECQLIDILFRTSMLGIVPGSHVGREKPKFRMPFTGTRLLLDGTPRWDLLDHEGFVVEKRRAMGGFRSEAA